MRDIGITALRTARRRAATIGLAMAGAGALLLGTGVATSPIALAVDTVTVPLSNEEAPAQRQCPDDVGDYWHFIVAPNNGTYTIVSITLTLDGDSIEFGADEIILNGTQRDNVFVEVPSGYELGDLTNEGSSAEISPATGTPRFVLSHLCDGTNVTVTTSTTVPDSTTSSTTSTSTSSTSTTSSSTSSTSSSTSSTSTTMPDTTTTEATTTTAAESLTTEATSTTAGPTTTDELVSNPPTNRPPTNTADVSSGGPLPAPAPGVQLPSTGGSTSSTALLGALLLVGGSILTITARRRSVG